MMLTASRGQARANSDSTTYNSSHVSAGNAVNITSGADTNLKGGNVSAQQVTANVGGNLNVESLQDTATSQASQKTTGIALSIPIVGTGGSASFSQSKQNSNSNYASVNEQSGINAGEGGFTINVGGNTDLKGATIVGSSDASKNTLTTNTLTTSDISNSMSASASSSGVSVGTNMMDGKYAMGKAIAGNLLNNGSASQSDASTTTSAISAAQVTVGNKTSDTSKEQLKDSNGKAVSTDTNNTNRTLVKADVAGLERSAKSQQADNMLTFQAATIVTTDLVNRQQTADQKILLQKCDANGQNCGPAKPVAANEVKVIDGKAYVFNNGIMNDEKQALENAAKQSSPEANQQGVYVIINPHTGNPVAEVLSAAWDKVNEITKAALPISNAAQANIDVRDAVKAQGGQVIEVDHSRGNLTGSVATSEQVNRGVTDAAIGSVTMNGAAANAQRMADQVNTATSGAGTVQQATHKDDTVGTLVGRNAATSDPNGNSLSFGKAHSSYTGSLPPTKLPDGTESELRDKTDSAWGAGQISKPVVITPSK